MNGGNESITDEKYELTVTYRFAESPKPRRRTTEGGESASPSMTGRSTTGGRGAAFAGGYRDAASGKGRLRAGITMPVPQEGMVR